MSKTAKVVLWVVVIGVVLYFAWKAYQRSQAPVVKPAATVNPSVGMAPQQVVTPYAQG